MNEEPFDPYWDDDEEPYEDPYGEALHVEALELAAIDDHNRAMRADPVSALVEAHNAWEQETERLQAPIPSGRSTLPRDPRHVEARHDGRILRQRTRWKTTTFGTDDDLRLFLAERSSLDFAEIVRPTPAGRLIAAERERRDEIARLVKLARAEGAGFEQLSRVLQRPLSRVHALARHAA